MTASLNPLELNSGAALKGRSPATLKGEAWGNGISVWCERIRLTADSALTFSRASEHKNANLPPPKNYALHP
jgi:hypothetical protein